MATGPLPTASLLLDEAVDEALSDGLLLGVAQKLRGLPVPLGDHPEGVHAEDGGVGRLDEPLKVVGDPLLLVCDLADLGDVLPDADDADDLAARAAPSGRVEQDVLALTSGDGTLWGVLL